MRRCTIASLLLFALTVSLYGLSKAQEPASTPAKKDAAKEQKLKIVPLVTVQPGETKELLLTTWCTVGVTRGGGFGLTEMQDGRYKGGGFGTKSYRRNGVTLTMPNFEEGVKFAGSPEYALLQKRGINAFKVTVAASRDAKPGLMEMHLVDATCGGHCKTDFRVLVVNR